MKRVAFYTLGCKLNYSETSTLGRMLSDEGFSTVSFQEPAEIYVINTCSVTDNADKKCRKVIREALKFNPQAQIVIIGCYAQLKPAEIAGIPGVSLVLGAAEKFKLAQHLRDLTQGQTARYIAGDIQKSNGFNAAYSVGERTRSFLKVQDGCDYSCSFCTIPLARGKSRSDTIAHVVEKAEEIARQDIKEIVLTGVNIGDFGKGSERHPREQEDFLQLIIALDKIAGIERFRISSIEPNLLTDEIITFVAGAHKFVPHFHLPLQSGNNKTLRSMRRRYLREHYAQRVEAIKEKMPAASIGADVIVGFPGETEEDFTDTCLFISELPISYLHVFTYSERDHTHALTLPHSVPAKDRNERSRILHILSDKKRRAFYESQIGTTRSVLWETEADGKMMHGFTENYVKVKTPYDPLLVNELSTVALRAIDQDMAVEVEECVRHL